MSSVYTESQFLTNCVRGIVCGLGVTTAILSVSEARWYAKLYCRYLFTGALGIIGSTVVGMWWDLTLSSTCEMRVIIAYICVYMSLLSFDALQLHKSFIIRSEWWVRSIIACAFLVKLGLVLTVLATLGYTISSNGVCGSGLNPSYLLSERIYAIFFDLVVVLTTYKDLQLPHSKLTLSSIWPLMICDVFVFLLAMVMDSVFVAIIYTYDNAVGLSFILSFANAGSVIYLYVFHRLTSYRIQSGRDQAKVEVLTVRSITNDNHESNV
jgi:hypothetical protein